jgi:choline dehydrogenase-like flavoprotein
LEVAPLGSVVAAIFSDAYTTAPILIIEAGPESFNLPAVVYLVLYRQNISPASATLKTELAGPEPLLDNRLLPILTGKTLGRGSAVSLLMYARGQRTDFDSWIAEG